MNLIIRSIILNYIEGLPIMQVNLIVKRIHLIILVAIIDI